jgi:hypothetical protein
MERQNKFELNPAYKSFTAAREFARALGLKSKHDRSKQLKRK